MERKQVIDGLKTIVADKKMWRNMDYYATVCKEALMLLEGQNTMIAPKTEKINHPKHYNMGKIEVIEAVEDWGFGEGFNRGNAIKYIARAGRKNKETEIEDLKKADWYIQREIKRICGQKGKAEDDT